MVRIITILTMSILLTASQVLACDSCGASSVGGGVGLLSAYRYNFVGLQWNYTRFNGTEGHGAGAKDDFHTIQLACRYHISKRFKILLYQPYKVNVRNFESESKQLNGFSDTRILGSYTLLNNKEITKKSKLFLELGGGLKLPIGKYDSNIHEKDLPENFNLGNGSLGFLFQPNIVWSMNGHGLALNGTALFHLKTKSGYHFGHQVSGQLTYFLEKKFKKGFKIVPNAGVFSEWIGQDNYANGNEVIGTGGKGVYLSAGLNIKKDNWVLSGSYSHPTIQNYSSGEVNANGRYSCQLLYVF